MIGRIVYIGTASLVFFVGAKFLANYAAHTSIPVVQPAGRAVVVLLGEV